MKADSPSFEEQQFTRAQHRISIRRLLNRDKTPLAILLAAAVVGTLAGLVGVAFEKAVNAVLNWRWAPWPVSPIAMAGLGVGVWLSALFAMVGYFLVRKFAPEAGGSGIPEIEGALEELRPVRWWR
jgi:CIC family chloride channel protein